MSPRLTTKFTAILCAVGAIAAAPALAGDSNRITRSVEVSYADLDLTNAADAKRLETRIRAAARKTCGTVQTRDLAERVDHAKCMTDALSGGTEAMQVAIAKARSGDRLAARDSSVVIGN